MKKINKYILIMFLFIPFTSFAQDLNSVLEEISKNNKQLVAYRELMNAEKYEAGIAQLPSNPEISYGYFPGSTSASGVKKTWSINQQIDFPSVYSYMRGVLKIKRVIASKKYEIGRQEILLSAKLSVLEYIYLQNLKKQIFSRTELINNLHVGIEKKFNSGEANIFEFNKIKVLKTNIQKDLSITNSMISKVKEYIRYLNGGELPLLPNSFNESIIDKEEDFISNVLMSLPQIDIMEENMELSKKQVKLSRSETLPKFNLGYESEESEGSQFRGVRLGMSIPLWGDRNKVKAAKAKASYQESELENIKADIVSEYKQNYRQAIAIKENIKELISVLYDENIKDKLLKAYKLGELSQYEYFGELEYYFSTENNLLELQRDFSRLVAQLYSYKL